MKLATAKRKYHDDWIAFRFTDEAKEEGRVIAHDKDRRKVFMRLARGGKLRKAYVTFGGPFVPPDVAVILLLS